MKNLLEEMTPHSDTWGTRVGGGKLAQREQTAMPETEVPASNLRGRDALVGHGMDALSGSTLAEGKTGRRTGRREISGQDFTTGAWATCGEF